MLQAAGAVPLGSFAIDGTMTEAIDSAVAELETELEGIATTPTPTSFEGWQAGDLHCHTQYSDDICSDPTCEEPWTYGFTVAEQIRNAELKGFDYLAITDHNTVETHDDDGYESDSVALLDGYEHSLSDGHAGFSGVEQVYDEPDDTDAELSALVESVHDDGGVGVINHPRTSISSVWEYGGPLGMDAVEVWSIAWYLREDRTGIGGNNHLALDMYDEYLTAGHRLAAVGGSDSHWRVLDPVGGVGTPTTWVRAPAGDETAVLDGIREGRTFISWDWTGPLVRIEARNGGSEYDLEIGDVGERSDQVAVRATTYGATGQRLRLVADGEPVAGTIASSPEFVWETTVPLEKVQTHNWLRAEVLYEDGQTMRALTSPIYFTEDGSPAEPIPVDADIEIPGFGEFSEGRSIDNQCECHSRERREAFHQLEFR